MEEIRISPSVTRAELEVHRVLALRGPVAAPFEAESAKRLDHVGVHVSSGPLRVRLRVQVDCNSPAVRRELAGGALAAKVEAAPEGLDLRVEALLRDGRQDGWKDVPQLHVALQLADDLGPVPGLRDRERQRGARQQLGLPPRVERAVLDRKSTRLNSSHTVISYAVFCLKKKR